MKFVTPKRGMLASAHRYLLCLTISFVLGISTTSAEERPVPYQSTFDDYKDTHQDTQADWKSLDSSIAQDAHPMTGMQPAADQAKSHEAMGHSMSHGDAHSPNGIQSEMHGMDHSQMRDMDHSGHDMQQARPLNPQNHQQHQHHQHANQAMPAEEGHSGHQQPFSEGGSHEH